MQRGTPSAAETTGTSRKQFMLLEGAPILVHTVRKFVASPLVHDIVVAVREEDIDWVDDMLHKEGRGLFGELRVVAGGNTRQESVENALAALDPDTDFVAVHDAVRPFVDLETIRSVVEEAADNGAAIVGIVPVDTVKQVSGAQASGAKVRSTISRERLVLAQTPQVFRYDLLRRAFEAARRDNFSGTDESSLVERLDQVEISVVLGSDRNIKITRPSDMDLARLVLRAGNARGAECRVSGQGWDVHRIVPGTPLILGGVTIPSEFGLEGHSDADVLAHAITDAILGAIAAGDIGMHFPDTDPRWKGADSLQFLEHACDLAARRRLWIVNVDSTVILERPKLKDFRLVMRESLAKTMGLDVSVVQSSSRLPRTGAGGRRAFRRGSGRWYVSFVFAIALILSLSTGFSL